MKHFFIFIVSPMILFSCGPEEKFKGPLSDIEKYTKKIDSIENLSNEIPYDTLAFILKEVHQFEAEVKKYFKDDTLEMEFARAMNEFKGIRKNMKDPENNKKIFHLEMEGLKKQLNDLEEDIKNGVLSKEEVQKYTAKEVADTKLLLQQFGLFHETADKVLDVYYLNREIIANTIKELKAKREREDITA